MQYINGKFVTDSSHFKYLEANLQEAIEGHDMNEDGTEVQDGCGKYARLPLTFLYFWNLTMNGEPGDTYEDEVGNTHHQFEIDEDEAKHIPGCVDLIEARGNGRIIDMWEDDNGFLHYDFRPNKKTDTGTRRVCFNVSVFVDVPDDFDFESEADVENFVTIIPKEGKGELDISVVTESVDES